jgi:tight adherence protein B
MAMRSFLPYFVLFGLPTALLVTLALWLRDLWRRRRQQQQRWLAGDGEDGPDLSERILAARVPQDWRGRMDHGFARLVQRTGLPLSPALAVGVLALGGLALGGLLLWTGPRWAAFLGLALGPLLPLGLLALLQGRWRRRLQDQLPDAFFLLARSLRAGLSLEEALGTVGQYSLEPLAGEFRRTSGQLQLGLTVTAALELTAARLRLADFSGLVALVALHRATGGNLPLLLDRWAGSTRDRNQFRGYFRAATALARITAGALMLAAPLMLLGYWMLQPDYLIRFARSTSGMVCLGVVLALEVLGAVWVFFLTRIDY